MKAFERLKEEDRKYIHRFSSKIEGPLLSWFYGISNDKLWASYIHMFEFALEKISFLSWIEGYFLLTLIQRVCYVYYFAF